MQTILALHHAGRGVSLPVVSTTCPVCNLHAEPNTSGVSPTRVGGDSKNGYELSHDACYEHGRYPIRPRVRFI